MSFFEMIASTDFVLFLLGIFGVSFYVYVHKLIKKCNPKVFSAICVVLTYIAIVFFSTETH